MRFLAADDKPLVLKDIKRTLEKVLPEGSEILTADNGEDVLEIVKNNDIRIAFFDIEMPGINGLELARLVFHISPRTNVYFITGFEKYAYEAWSMNEMSVCGYIKKPLTEVRLNRALGTLKYPLHDMRIKCFGNFEVFYKERPLALGGEIARKILAYLVHLNGSSCTMGELATAVWEDRMDEGTLSNQLRTHIVKLKRSLAAADMEELLVKHEYNRISVDTSMFDCDYYDYLAGSENAKALSVQGYMIEFPWGTKEPVRR